MKVFLTGATGFVGSHLLRRLLHDDHGVRALVRRSQALSHPDSGNLEQVEGDLNSPQLATYMAGCDAVINLVGIIYERGSSTFEAVHHVGTRNLLEAACTGGIGRFVQMSALGARSSQATAYHATKFAAEKAVREGGIPYVILRPSLIFGAGSGFIQQMIGLVQAVPWIYPVAGTGQYRFRPIHVNDVVECFAQSLTNADAKGKTIELVGAEEVTLDEITDQIANALNVGKHPVHIPMPLMKAAAAVWGLLPARPPVTLVQLRMLEEGSTADPAAIEEIFRIKPAAFREAIRRELGR